jgi:hypothetical protein
MTSNDVKLYQLTNFYTVLSLFISFDVQNKSVNWCVIYVELRQLTSNDVTYRKDCGLNSIKIQASVEFTVLLTFFLFFQVLSCLKWNDTFYTYVHMQNRVVIYL